jgi:hypothetical protein
MKSEAFTKFVKPGLLFLLFVLIVFVRVYGLDDTARFTQDESTDLVRMQQYWQDKKITLVGPISTDNTKVFGSLTYYMQMPFAVAGNFDPVSPVYAMSFWGVLTALLVLVITARVNRKMLWAAVILTVVWYPLLETSRWAWNPHLVLFWIALGITILVTQKRTLFWNFAAGICFGLTIHHHYIAFLATAAFIGWQSFSLIWQRKYALATALFLGYAILFVPFLIFDLRHPPGLFINRYLLGEGTPHVATTNGDIMERFIRGFMVAGLTIVKHQFFAAAVLITSMILIAADLLKRSKSLLWLLPVLPQILISIVLENYETRYFLPGLLFYYLWLIHPRNDKKSSYLQRIVAGIIIAGSLWTIPLVTQPEAQPTIRVLRSASDSIAKIYQTHPIKNANVAAVASPDSDLISLKYRDLLSLRHVPLRAASEYDASENLFVISTSDEMRVKGDDSAPMVMFKNAVLKGAYPLVVPPWTLYWYGYQ